MAHCVSCSAPVCVVGEIFCMPYPIDLVVKKKHCGLTGAHFDVLDTAGKLVLRVDGGLNHHLHKKRVMRDAAGSPILCMSGKALTLHHKWTVHRGDSSRGDLLMSVQRSHALQLKTELDVFLPSNFMQDECDYLVSGRFSNHSCKIYKGQSIIAEVNHHYTLHSLVGEEKFTIRVSSNVDYAFIVALAVVRHETEICC